MAQLAPFFRTVFTKVDGDGNVVPLAGGFLYTYISGTTTNKDTYTDQAQSGTNTHPITLGADGGCDLWLSTTGSYTLLLKDSAGATVDSWDAVAAVPATVSGSYVPLDGATAMTGLLTLSGNATANLHAVPLQQVNSLIATSAAADAALLAAGLASVTLPTQASHADEVLTTDGTTASWSPLADLVTGTIGSAGSLTLPGGLIVKWGTTGTIAVDTVGSTVTFPVAFPSACYGALCNPTTDSGVGAVLYSWGCHTFTTSSFKINNDASSSTFFWIALGS